MEQAQNDLPDPIRQPGLDDAPSADDLLAQMAGEEIDRLLADESALEEISSASASRPMDVPPASVPSAPAAAPAASIEEPDSETARQLDALFAELVSSEPPVPANPPPRLAPAPAPAPVPVAHAEADAAISQQLDDLFAQLQAGEPVAGAAETPPAPAPAPAEPPVPISLDPADQTSALERQVLAAEVLDPEPAEPEPAPVEGDLPIEPPTPRVPLYLRLLELINAPVANISDTFREALGKVAIATLVNALLILMYVLFVRGE